MKYRQTLQRLVQGALVSTGLLLTTTIAVAHADSFTDTVNVGPTCIASINTPGFNVTPGSSVNITVFNSSTSTAVSVSGPGISDQIDPNQKTPNHNPVTLSLGPINSLTKLTFTPIPSDNVDITIDNSCPTSSTPKAAYILVNPVTPPAPAPTPKTAVATTQKTSNPPASTPTPSTQPTTPTKPAAKKSTSAKHSTSITTSPAASKHSALVWVIPVIALLIALALAFWWGLIPYQKMYRFFRK